MCVQLKAMHEYKFQRTLKAALGVSRPARDRHQQLPVRA